MVRIVLKVVIRRVRMVARTVRIGRMVTKPALLTKMGVPAPFTVETIIDIQVPRNKTPPNTNGCSGSLGGLYCSSFDLLVICGVTYVLLISLLSSSR